MVLVTGMRPSLVSRKANARPTPPARVPTCLDEHEIAEVYANPWIVHTMSADRIANTLAKQADRLAALAADRETVDAGLRRIGSRVSDPWTHAEIRDLLERP